MLESAVGRGRQLGIARRQALESALVRWRQIGIARKKALESDRGVVGVNLVSLEDRSWSRHYDVGVNLASLEDRCWSQR